MCRVSDWTLDTQNLAQLCSCCPAVESLAFALESDPGQLALEPLLQLSALTSLRTNQQTPSAASMALHSVPWRPLQVQQRQQRLWEWQHS
jgi:hypothetical protein